MRDFRQPAFSLCPSEQFSATRRVRLAYGGLRSAALSVALRGFDWALDAC
jgi:hypothetical protein